MSETMVERVARAICRATHPDMPWDRVIEFYPQARAAIAAMREPTEAMLDEAERWTFYCEECKESTIHRDRVWAAMIEAALKQP